jgi:N-formylglutamate amidohydrolase
LRIRYSSFMPRVVISIPHASLAIPDDIRARFARHINEDYLRRFSDIDTDKIYSLPNARWVRFPWSRYVVDPNRAEQQTSSGGVVPIDCFDWKPLYLEGQEPGAEERRQRVLRYHRPHHLLVNSEVRKPETSFFVDGHSMAGVAPPRTANPGEKRPDAVLSNLGDSEGNPTPGTPFLSCPPDLFRYAADRLGYWMAELPLSPGPAESSLQGRVNLNTPFPGGYGVRTHAAPSKGIPGIQMELNQSLWIDEVSYKAIPGRIDWMRSVLIHWIDDITQRRSDELSGKIQTGPIRGAPSIPVDDSR